MKRADIDRMPESPGKDRLIAALRDADEAHKKIESARIAALPDLPISMVRPSKAEKQLQQAGEGILSVRGYRRMTAPEKTAYRSSGMAAGLNGWFAHIAKPQGNPLMPDLMIFDRTMTRCCMVELKTRPVYQPGQTEFISCGCWKLAFSFDEFLLILAAWEKGQL